MPQAKVGLLIVYNNAGTWQAGIIVAVTGDSLCNILVFTTVTTSFTNVVFTGTGAVSTCQPAPRV
jgi:hypothetical protein